ncbi:DNA polymerase epsilon catalytic subunit [Balamuthia mandrillaris]
MADHRPKNSYRRGGGGGGRGRGRGGGGGGGGSGGTFTQSKKKFKKKAANKDADEDLFEDGAEENAREMQEAKFGFVRVDDQLRTGWLLNMQPTTMEEKETGVTKMAVDYYFMEEDGTTFKATVPYHPYFYLDVKPKFFAEVEDCLRRKFELHDIQAVEKHDLSMPNHLTGLTKKYMKVSFNTVSELLAMRKKLARHIELNKKRSHIDATYDESALSLTMTGGGSGTFQERVKDYKEHILDIREYDVPYYIRAAIDLGIRVGRWYDIVPQEGGVRLREREEEHRPEPRICAFDIETTKLPLKFPDPSIDRVMMISYMLDTQGYLIVNREIVTKDIDDFECTPKKEYPGPFIVFNEPDELSVLRKWMDHMKEAKPNIYVTFNGDFFDWPFLEKRAAAHGLSMYDEIGFCDRAKGNSSGGGSGNAEYKCRFASHLDAFKWVKRDSYLPQGSQGLKAVTKAKLGYDPLELDPEEMVPMASKDPQTLASYSVSDAVCTYYLYQNYVHPFIFSLCTIIPMNPDDVLRKGSGTLCEALLMVEAFKKNIIYPNKQTSEFGKMYKGHLLESETYIGGHVECLESGVYRSDLAVQFTISRKAIRSLIQDLDNALSMELKSSHIDPSSVLNFEEVKAQISEKLVGVMNLEEDLVQKKIEEDAMHEDIHKLDRMEMEQAKKEQKERKEDGEEEEKSEDWLYCRSLPVIYHLDVAAMYPNIILSNRLQPSAIVTPATCARCDFNTPDAQCQRHMQWTWRGEFMPATRSEYELVKTQLESEWLQKGEKLPLDKQHAMLKTRLGEYSKTVYKKKHVKETEEREARICMRENPFYVDTVRAFRDRRYKYKDELKNWKDNLTAATQTGSVPDIYRAKSMTVLYDSLQLAHKCILNSFYGYVMRRGARWYSMEMAGVVTHTGAQIITEARKCVESLGRPLELDTDGIWCLLPAAFPQNFAFQYHASDGKKRTRVFSYPCLMLNKLVRDKFTNHQYHITHPDDPSKLLEIKDECTVEFEVDGPYKAMILPASKEEDKLIKKRYAVFNHDGKLAELKGFEVKRRGELKAVKIFQAEVFEKFLEGKTLEECYAAVGRVADNWLDILYTQGAKLPDEELLDLISESRNMTKTLEDYGEQKSTAITTARRLAEFLGVEMTQDKGLSCQFIIAKKPVGGQVTERAMPVKIFAPEISEAKRAYFLRKWCRDEGMTDFSIREIIDWDYYIDRLGSTIQKIVTIPAALQQVPNPVPRVEHPAWLMKRLKASSETHKQTKISSHFRRIKASASASQESQKKMVVDIEDGGGILGGEVNLSMFPSRAVVRIHKRGRGGKGAEEEAGDEEKVDDEEEEEMAMLRPNAPKQRRLLDSFVRRKQSNSKDKEKEKESENEIPPPDPSEDWNGWIRCMKKKWKERRALRKQRRLDGGAALVGRNNVQSFLHSKRLALLRSEWEIVQMVETDMPGVLRMWILVEDDLHSITVEVPRTFYVNSRQPHSGDSVQLGRKVEKHLPRSRPCLNLYEITLSEKNYLSNATELAAHFSDPQVEGVYETKVSPLFRALLTLGSVCSLESGARQRRLAAERNSNNNVSLTHYYLEELEAKQRDNNNSTTWANNNEHKTNAFSSLLGGGRKASSSSGAKALYLDNSGDRYRCLYLYHSLTADGHRGVYVLFPSWTESSQTQQPAASEENNEPYSSAASSYQPRFRAIVYLVHPSTHAAPSKTLQKKLEELLSPDRLVQVQHFTSTSSAQKALQKQLRTYRAVGSKPTILLTQVSSSSSTIAEMASSNVPALKEYPKVCIAGNAGDNVYPAFGWETWIAQVIAQRFKHSTTWLKDQIGFSRYVKVPLGNFTPDYTILIADVFFARLLKRESHLLWFSETNRPDLGGTEEDDNYFSAVAITEDLVQPEISVADCYDRICVEIELSGLAVNTILESSHVHELEGAGSDFVQSFTFQDSKAQQATEQFNSFVDDDTGACARTFRVLKNLISLWSSDLTRAISSSSSSSSSSSYNMYADNLIAHFYRWLSNSDSLLYDPALHRLVHMLMKKVWLQLVSKFRSLGAKIVFANFNKIIICTNKETLENAQQYTKYIIQELKQGYTLFRWMDLEPRCYWHTLLFMDRANYGGVLAASPLEKEKKTKKKVDHTNEEENGMLLEEREEDEEEKEGEEDEDGDEPKFDEDEKLNVVANWNIAEYLPKSLSKYFNLTISQFIKHVHDNRNLHADLRSNKTLSSSSLTDQKQKQKQPLEEENENMDLAINEENEDKDDKEENKENQHANNNNKKNKSRLFELSEEEHKALKVKMSQQVYVEEEELEHEQMTKILPSTFTQKLFTVVRDIQRNAATFALQHRQLSSRDLTKTKRKDERREENSNPALEFIKYVCQAMSVDKSLQREVFTLRSALMKLVNVRPFDPVAQFKDPCQSFVLPDVICSFCSACRDMDLLRDPDLFSSSSSAPSASSFNEEEEEENDSDRGRKEDGWRCRQCHHSLDKQQIEMSLVRILQTHSLSYQIQDLSCVRCRMVRAENMSQRCGKCSADFRAAKETQRSMRERLKVFERVAEVHGFEVLKEVTEWMLSM